MSLGLSFKSEVGGIVAASSLSDGVLNIMESKLEASHPARDPILSQSGPAIAPSGPGA